MPRGLTQPDWLMQAAGEKPDALALVQGDVTWDYETLNIYVGFMAAGLDDLGVRAGARIGNHTRTHPWLPGLPFARAQREICGASRELARRLGNRPVVMRPPYGGWSVRLMPTAEACGIHTIVLWSAEVIHGQLITRNGGGLRGGDIVLLHFRRDLRRDLIVLRAAARERGLRFAPLANYL